MSTPQEKGIELKVGIFVFIGLLFIAVMAVKFGQVGQGFKDFYPLTIDFPNASGLIKNSDVQMAGARIGYVSEKPRIAENAGSVAVTLQIAEGIKIPRSARFQVGSSGLLGDRFVEVVTPPDFDPAGFNPDDPAQRLNPGDRIKGIRAGGLEALQKKGEEVFDQLKIAITKLTDVTEKINNDVLSAENRKNISTTFANLKTTSESFAETSRNLNLVVQNAQGTVDTTKQTMVTVNAAAGDLRGAIGDARKMLDSGRNLVTRAQTGDGLIATLLNDRQLSENLQALIINLRNHGVLFYKNRATIGRESEVAERAGQTPQGALPARLERRSQAEQRLRR